jgi:hypothetical protein
MKYVAEYVIGKYIRSILVLRKNSEYANLYKSVSRAP